ncbi:MAG: hypothetical protein WC455_17910 [Dehalococcoidia bacterium]|jgi:hypothetical protein
MIDINFVDGTLGKDGLYVADFLSTDVSGKQFEQGGVAGYFLGGYRVPPDNSWFSHIYVVKQGRATKTLAILIHELCHAFVWRWMGGNKMAHDWIDRHVFVGGKSWK